jgi:hypothetical protein
MTLKPICLAVVATCAVACGSNHSISISTSSSSSSSDIHGGPATQVRSAPTAQSAAETIKAAIPEVAEIIAITENNDANNMIGRSNGYVAATVIVDSRVGARAGGLDEGCSMDKPGIVCGAGVEQWPDAAATQTRATYLKTIMTSMPMLGTEYQTVKGNLLLRVSGKLKPSEAQAYQAVFTR